MRAVFDTNVLVSALMNPYGSPGRILDLMLSRAFVVLRDDRILREYRDVLLRPRFGFDPADLVLLFDYVERAGEYVAAARLNVVLPDATDLPFLEVAAAGRADALITGNVRHYKPRRGHHSVNITSPADFLRRLV
ncbi:MAG: putative toxin-antitoxin system toxin component, PIN family [Acidobacteriia bacterium]|nr:putative toxin-antitoxin system toxin component, PIN family [Terriglobia bacterium]